jgi:hypothetical protein
MYIDSAAARFDAADSASFSFDCQWLQQLIGTAALYEYGMTHNVNMLSGSMLTYDHSFVIMHVLLLSCARSSTLVQRLARSVFYTIHSDMRSHCVVPSHK